MELSPEHAAYLGSHQYGALSTGRRDGSPQVSMIGYCRDGHDILVTFRSTAAKYHNVRRQPRVALLVPDGSAALTVYGDGQLIEADPERAESYGKILESFGMPAKTIAELTAMADAEQRVVLRITPTQSDLHE